MQRCAGRGKALGHRTVQQLLPVAGAPETPYRVREDRVLQGGQGALRVGEEAERGAPALLRAAVGRQGLDAPDAVGDGRVRVVARRGLGGQAGAQAGQFQLAGAEHAAEAAEHLAARGQQFRVRAERGVALRVEPERGVQHRDLAQRGRGGVPSGDPGGGRVGGVLLAARTGQRGTEVEPGVGGVDPCHRPVRDARVAGVDLPGLLALGRRLGVLLLLPGLFACRRPPGALLELLDGAQDLGAAAHGDGGEAGVGVGVVAELVREHRP